MKTNILKGKIFKDKRGFISDVLYNKKINHIAYIYSKKNAVRGNHFHKKTSQYNLIVKGKIRYYCKEGKKKTKVYNLKKGDLILSKANQIHAFKTISDNSIFMVFTLGVRGGKDYEKDTFRVNSIIK